MEEQEIKKITEEFLGMLGVSASVTATLSDDICEVVLQAEDTGMLIGYHGETLESLQLVLSLLVAKKLGKFVRISLEIGDYKKNRSSYLESLVHDAKNKVLDTNEGVSLPSLKSWERRLVHLMLQDDKEVVTESVGEGRDRTLTIKPR